MNWSLWVWFYESKQQAIRDKETNSSYTFLCCLWHLVGIQNQPGIANRNSSFFSVSFSYFLHLHGNYFHVTVNKCKKNGARSCHNLYTTLSTSELNFKQRTPQDSLQKQFLNTWLTKCLRAASVGLPRTNLITAFNPEVTSAEDKERAVDAACVEEGFWGRLPQTLGSMRYKLNKGTIGKVSGKCAGLLAQRVVISKVQLEARKLVQSLRDVYWHV